jgi:hypothetical protein
MLKQQLPSLPFLGALIVLMGIEVTLSNDKVRSILWDVAFLAVLFAGFWVRRRKSGR